MSLDIIVAAYKYMISMCISIYILSIYNSCIQLYIIRLQNGYRKVRYSNLRSFAYSNLRSPSLLEFTIVQIHVLSQCYVTTIMSCL